MPAHMRSHNSCSPNNKIVFRHVDVPPDAIYNSIRINSMLTLRSLSVVAELFAATVLVIWIAAGCVLLAINGAPP